MPRPTAVAAALKRQAKEQQRQRILQLHSEGKSYAAIGAKENVSKVRCKHLFEVNGAVHLSELRFKTVNDC